MSAPPQKKRRLAIESDGLKAMLDKYSAIEPKGYADAFQALCTEIREVIKQADLLESPPTLPASSLSLGAAQDMFNLLPIRTVFWRDVQEQKIPKYLLENIQRKKAITDYTHQGTEVLSRTIIDEIISSAVYEDSFGKHEYSTSLAPPSPIRSTPKSDEPPALLQLQYETEIQRRVMYKGTERLLTGFADCLIGYDTPRKSELATNLIIVEAKKPGHTDTCIPQLTAYMGTVHALRKDEGKANAVVYGVATDGLAFRFCRIDNNGDWSRSPLWEWDAGDAPKIYSTFRTLIRIADLSSPSTSPIKDPARRRIVLVKCQKPSRESHYDIGPYSDLLTDEDSETEYIDWPLSSKED